MMSTVATGTVCWSLSSGRVVMIAGCGCPKQQEPCCDRSVAGDVVVAGGNLFVFGQIGRQQRLIALFPAPLADDAAQHGPQVPPRELRHWPCTEGLDETGECATRVASLEERPVGGIQDVGIDPPTETPGS